MRIVVGTGVRAIALKLCAIALLLPTLLVAGADAAPTELPQQSGIVDLPGGANLELFGANGYDTSGESVAPAGDVNGDGLSDLVVGAPAASNNGRRNSGSVYVIFGRRLPGSIALGSLGQSGYRIDGARVGDYAGQSVASIGDVNGDGRPDLLIGAPYADPNARNDSGAAYVVFGKASTDNIDLASLGDSGFRIDGAGAYDRLGTSVAGAGDVNGDGRPDLLIGAPDSDAQARYGSGSAYVVFGKTSVAEIDLASLGDGGFRVDGAASFDDAGTSVAGIGDVNGDRRPDLLIGAPSADGSVGYNSGAAYVVFGQSANTNVDLAKLGEDGFRIDGANAYDYAGVSVAGAGDVNSDGRPDLLIGADGASNNGRLDSGSAYVVFGRETPGNVDLAKLGAGGFRIDGANVNDSLGTSVAAAGDVNSDGRPDLLVGMVGTNGSGAAVVYGRATPTNVDLAASGLSGFVADDVAADKAGSSVAAAGDVNGDGRADVVVGAPWARSQDQWYAGGTYVLYGFGIPRVAYAPLVAVAGKPVTPALPSDLEQTGAATFAVSPRLPVGLLLDRSTGVVSGTAARPEPRTSYTVTMTDLSGAAHAQLSITIRDETAPALHVRARQQQHVLHQRGVIVAGTCNEACTLLASGDLTVAGTRVTIGLKPARAILRTAGASTLELGLSGAAQTRLARLLGRHGHGRAKVTVRAVDRSGNAASAVRIVSLTS